MTVTALPSTTARSIPYDTQAEASLLGAMLLSKDAIEAAVETPLTATDFYNPAHGLIYDAVVALHVASQPADPITVADELRRAGVIDRIGGPALLVTLQANTPATSNARRYARIVKDHSLMRRLAHVAGDIAETALSRPSDVYATLDDAEAAVFDLAQHHQADTLHTLNDSIESVLDVIEARYESDGAISGQSTGLTDLDELLSGLQRSALYVIGARPSAGKTALAMSIVQHVGIDQHQPVVVFSLEMSDRDLTQRLLSMEARVDSKRMQNGKLTDTDWGKLAHAMGRCADAPVWIDDNPQQTIMGIRGKARRIKARLGLGLVVVDYVQLMTGRTSAESRQVEVSEISRGLKILARELDCPVIALSQLSRGLEMRADKRPMLSDLRETGALEQDADVVLFIYRDEMYVPDSPDRGTAELIVAKQRNGPTGVVRAAFLDHYTKFANMARGV